MTEPRLLECGACGYGWSSTLGPTCERCGAPGTAIIDLNDDPPPMPPKARRSVNLIVTGRRKGKPNFGDDSHLTEYYFQRTVIETAQALGWRVAAFRPGMTSRVSRDGKPVWVTPMQGQPGYPDLTLVRAARLIFAELKADKGVLSPEQRAWQADLRVLHECGKCESYVWRPADWDEIEKVLR